MSHYSQANANNVAAHERPPLASRESSSPRSVRLIANHDQTKQRGGVVGEMVSEILQCPLDDFLKHYASFIPSQESIHGALQAYKDKDSVLPDTDKYLEEVDVGGNKVLTWSDYDYPPARIDGSEMEVFKYLERIVGFLEDVECRDLLSRKRTRHYSYKDCPHETIKSEIPGTDFKVDGRITSDPDSDDVVLSETAVLAEFKKVEKPDDVADNRKKLVSAASHLMNDDPRRTWVYGITIENTQMSVWYFCRSHSVKSESFDFTNNLEKFIQVFLSFLYATPKEIGYDPTVHRLSYGGGICYVYEMGTAEAPRYFRTTEPLFTPRVLCITGRKTRVWKAIEVRGLEGDSLSKTVGSPVALKDGWLDGGSQTESGVQKKIFDRLECVQEASYAWAPRVLRGLLDDAFQNHSYKDYFLEILDSRELMTTKARLSAAQPKPSILSSALPALADSKNVVAGSTQGTNRSGPSASLPAASTTTTTEENQTSREYKIKQQYRLIYRDVGCPLHDAKDLKTSFKAIRDTYIALVLMYLAGWTHRDVSTGNIIVFGSGDLARGKLNDLEYAKEFNNSSCSADPKTGTPYFMPLEIHRSKRLFTLSATKPKYLLDDDDVFIRKGTPQEPVESPEPLPPKFRFQHDLESLWWIALWILLYRVKHDKTANVGRVFTDDNYPAPDRVDLFCEERFTLSLNSKVAMQFFDHVEALNNVRMMLYYSYTEKQFSTKEAMHDVSTYSEIYQIAWAGFNTLASLAPNIVFDIDTASVLQKRPRSQPKPKDGDNYEPGADEQDSDTSLEGMGHKRKIQRHGGD